MESTPIAATFLRRLLQRLRRDEDGQGMVEYVFIVVLIAIAVLIALQVLGHSTNNLFSNISNGLAA
jgi:Flp pilus assembly pilin Flp